MSIWGLEVGSWADLFSAIGTIGAVIVSLVLVFKQRKRETKREKERLEQEVTRLQRIYEGIESARDYNEKSGQYTLKEVWKNQLFNLYNLVRILDRECYSSEARSVNLFIEYMEKHSNTDLKNLNEQLKDPILKLKKLILNKKKILTKYDKKKS